MSGTAAPKLGQPQPVLNVGAGASSSDASRTGSANGRTYTERASEYCKGIDWNKVGKVALIILSVIAVAAALSTVVISALAATQQISYTAVPLIGNALAGTYGTVILTSIAVGGLVLGAALFYAQTKVITAKEKPFHEAEVDFHKAVKEVKAQQKAVEKAMEADVAAQADKALSAEKKEEAAEAARKAQKALHTANAGFEKAKNKHLYNV